MEYELKSVGYYVSPQGGAPTPYAVRDGQILFEVITAGAVFVPDGEELCGAGWVFAHRAGDSTVWQSPAEGHYECMAAAFALGPAPMTEVWPRRFFWGDDEGAVRFTQEALYAFHHTHVDRGLLGDLVWSQLRFRLDHFRRHESRRDIPAPVSVVMAHIDTHYAEPLGMSELSARVGLSASHLHACFRRSAGMTPHQYLIRQRMRAARHRLAATNAPIKAIALDVGYANAENFCRAFRQQFGRTATAYRRKYMIYQ